QAPARRRAALRRRRGVRDADGAEIVREDVTELVAPDLADVLRARAERRHSDHRVRGRATGHLDARSHGRIEGGRTGLVDELHRALGEPVTTQEVLALVTQHVDQRVADAEDVELSHDAAFARPTWPRAGSTCRSADRAGAGWRAETRPGS